MEPVESVLHFISSLCVVSQFPSSIVREKRSLSLRIPSFQPPSPKAGHLIDALACMTSCLDYRKPRLLSCGDRLLTWQTCYAVPSACALALLHPMSRKSSSLPISRETVIVTHPKCKTNISSLFEIRCSLF